MTVMTGPTLKTQTMDGAGAKNLLLDHGKVSQTTESLLIYMVAILFSQEDSEMSMFLMLNLPQGSKKFFSN